MRPEILYPLFASVTRVQGVGPAIAKALQRVLPAAEGELPIVRDLLFHLPAGLIDRRATFPLHSAPAGVTATFVVKVESHQPPPRAARGSRRPYKVICVNETGDLTLVFFHAAEDYLKQALPVGQMRVISGTTEIFDYRLQITHPEIIAPVARLQQVQTVEPVYPLTAGLTNRKLTTLVQAALKGAPALPEWVDAATLARFGWPGWRESLASVHAPKSAEDLVPETPARSRLAYDEILANQLHLALLRGKMEQKPRRVIRSTGALRKAFMERLPFTLTAGQLQAVADIDADMASGVRMIRLLQGDVGSGKTVVALMAALSVAEGGAQAALMVPTELIAQQHAATLSRLTEGLGFRVARLTGGIKGKQREAVLESIRGGEAQLVVGTHALFQEHVEFRDLALLVIDEQHRFGVAQRTAMSAKGAAPHLLHMTATPIPRSLTMTVYGDMDSSLLTEKPAGRQPVTTRAVPASRMDEVLEGISRVFAKGEKIYWICPQIEEGANVANDETAAAEARYIMFKAMLGEASVGLVHGRMRPDAREQAMRRFAEGDVRLLVATTVVEVGVDVCDATIIVIEQAERFGLSQLHQLRGRVGRGEHPSACVLLYSDAADADARARLAILRESNDGFRIAEEDLKIRGGGDLLGTRQSGMPLFRFIDLVRHQPLIAHARGQVKQLLKEDAALETEQGKAARILLALFGYEYGY